MSQPNKRIKLAHHARSDSQQARDVWDQLALQADFLPKPLPLPAVFVDISRLELPDETVFQMLHERIGRQQFEVAEVHSAGAPHYQVCYNSPSNPDSLALIANVPNFPQHRRTEYLRFRTLSWLKDRKDFQDPYTFYMGHLLMSLAGNVEPYVFPRRHPGMSYALHTRASRCRSYGP